MINRWIYTYIYRERERVLTLWRVPLYNLPGLPRPTMSQGFFASTSTSVAAAVEVELAVMVIRLAEVEDEGSCIVIYLSLLLLHLQLKMKYRGLIEEVERPTNRKETADEYEYSRNCNENRKNQTL